MPTTLPPPVAPCRARLLVALLALLLANGCGSSGEPDDDPGAGPDGPRVADARFDGRFEVTEVEVDGAVVAVEQRPSIEIDAEFGGLTVLPGCNTYFGSFTLDEDGAASFTVTGGSDADCGGLADQEELVLAALTGADRWGETDGGFRFDGPTSSVSVVGPIG